MRILVIFMLMLTITACGSNNASTTAGEVTGEEKKYIDLVFKDDYQTLLSTTQERDNELQFDYNYLAQALIKKETLVNKYGENLEIKLDFEVLIAYRNLESILKYIDDFNYGDDEIKNSVDLLEKWAIEKQNSLKDRYEEVAKKQKEYEDKMEKLNKEAEQNK